MAYKYSKYTTTPGLRNLQIKYVKSVVSLVCLKIFLYTKIPKNT